MNLQSLEEKSKRLIRLLEQQRETERQGEALKAELLPEIKESVQPNEEQQRRLQFKTFEILLSTCPGKKSLDLEKVAEEFPDITSDKFLKQGKPYDQLRYTIRLQEDV